MGYMFGFATQFNQPLGAWDVSSDSHVAHKLDSVTSSTPALKVMSKVTVMEHKRNAASQFQPDFGGVDVSKVMNMGMFYFAGQLTSSGAWDVSRGQLQLRF